MRLLRLLRRFLHLVVILGLVGLNIATLTVGAIADALGRVVEATGAKSVHGQQKAKLKALDARAQAQAKRLARLDADFKAQAEALKAKEARLARTRAQFENQRSTLARERARFDDLESRFARHRAATASARQTAARSVGRIQTRMAGRAKKKVAAAFGQGIPIAGIFVIAGMTAYELKGMCDTMHDLSEIDAAFSLEGGTEAEAETVCGIEPPGIADIQARVLSAPGTVWTEMDAMLPDALPERAGWMPGLGWLNPFGD